MNRIKSLDYSFDARVDKEIFLDRLKNYANIDNSYRRPIYSELLGLDGDFAETKNTVEEIYSTEFNNSETLLQLMDLNLEELNRSLDPLVTFAKKTYQESLDMKRNMKHEALEGNY